MHITTTELGIAPSVVATVAIIGAYLNVRSTNRSQARLTHESYDRDRLTETYIDLLKGIHFRNAQLDDTYSRPINAPARTPTRSEFDPTTDNEALFVARLMAYASPKVDNLWGEFAKLTTEFDNYMITLRQAMRCPPEQVQGSSRKELHEMFNNWHEKRDELKNLIRSELRSR